MEKRIIYADNAATTQVSKPVLEAMLPYLTGQYGNPSSIYALGRHAQRDIELARQQVAEALGCEPGEIFFTGCGTESDNWAIRSTAARLGAKGKCHIVTSVFEHHAVLHTCAALEKEGFEVTYLPVTREDVDYIIWAVHQAAERGRAMSPLWEAIRAGKVDYPDI